VAPPNRRAREINVQVPSRQRYTATASSSSLTRTTLTFVHVNLLHSLQRADAAASGSSAEPIRKKARSVPPKRTARVVLAMAAGATVVPR